MSRRRGASGAEIAGTALAGGAVSVLSASESAGRCSAGLVGALTAQSTTLSPCGAGGFYTF